MPTADAASRPLVRPPVPVRASVSQAQEFEVLGEILASLEQASGLLKGAVAEIHLQKISGHTSVANWELNQRVGAAVRLAQAAQILLGGDGRR